MSIKTVNPTYPEEQRAYANAVREKLLQKGILSPKACVITYGCQQNVSDSQHIKGILALMGYKMTEAREEADFIIFNTCAVREHAEDRVFGNVGTTKKLKQENPELLVAVCGCMAQQERIAEKIKNSYPYVDILFGTQVTHRLPEFIYKRLTSGKRVFERKLDNESIVEDVPIDREGKIKGYIPVMSGCDNFCTYCIVPYVRGRERSRDAAVILEEAKQMVAEGYKEIMLLGQNVNSYGKDNADGINFAKLLRMINGIEGDFRIRFMTSHPKDCTEELLEAMRDCEKVENHLHLPFQSGSTRVLKAMNRKYTREEYLSLIRSARKKMPDIAFTSDVIVGFPGETYEDFKETVSLIKEVGFASLFTFIYSPRSGTVAAGLPDPVSRREKGVWFDEMIKLQDKIQKQYNESVVGKTFRVLFEEEATEDGCLIGKNDTILNITVKADKSLLGTFADIRVTAYNGHLSGVLI